MTYKSYVAHVKSSEVIKRKIVSVAHHSLGAIEGVQRGQFRTRMLWRELGSASTIIANTSAIALTLGSRRDEWIIASPRCFRPPLLIQCYLLNWEHL
jgi:hypothetical protein